MMKFIREKKWILIISMAVLLLSCAATVFLWKYNSYYLELSVPNETLVLEYGTEKLVEVDALCKGTIFNRKGTTVKAKVSGDIDYQTLGTYDIEIKATYKEQKLTAKKAVLIQDTVAPEIVLVTKPDYYANPGLGYQEEGFTATDNFDGDLTDQVKSVEKDGVVTYTVKDSSGNKSTVERTLVYKDVIAPVITLKKGKSISINKGTEFKDPGFKAEDETDGTLTKQVQVDGSVDTSKYGTYKITYCVTDASGNEAKVTRKVKVADLSAPVITLKGETRLFIKVGSSYTEQGYTATDNIDGNLSKKVSVSGAVDTKKMGINVLNYTVSDEYGNKTTVQRKVYVYKKQATSNPVNPGNKVVYLTFDDGPSRYTQQLLNILDKYGVKATFFVTNQFPTYQNMIGETYRKGHTIAIHTYTHQYQNIYASEEAYYKDLELIKDVCVKQTGVVPKLVRFPGGTANGVSANYCKGLMSSLVKSISYYGYLYCDWNVSSGDANGTVTKEQIINNVISGIKSRSVSIVLQHDIKQSSVEAVEDILFWGIQNGYTFLPMSETTPLVQFKPIN